MTNRDKINKMSNEEFAEEVLYNSRCEFCSNQNHICECGLGGETLREDCIKGIKQWLSQEAEEDIVNIPNIGKMPKTDKEWLKEVERKNEEYTEDEFAQALIKESFGIDENHTQVTNLSTETKKIELTKKAYEDILSRLDKLEESEYHNAMAIERLEKINEYESNIDDVETKTADEMFKEIGYEKINDCEYKRIKPDKNGSEVFITIDDGEVIKYIKDKNLNAGIAEWILSKELKAIHKKIEELKNG